MVRSDLLLLGVIVVDVFDAHYVLVGRATF